MKKIIIVEDAERIRLELTEVFERYGYEVKVPDNFDNVLDFVKRENADLIILDINLPIFDGYYLCREIRKNSDIPIIIVTSRDSDMDELMSINLGADDFITKPYNIEILLARANSLIRRSSRQSTTKDKLNYNDIEINLYNSSMTYKNKNIELTKNELKILIFLVRNKGVIVSREELMEHLWNDDFFVDNSTLSVNVTRIRKKLAEIGLDDAIETRRGQGYIMP